MPPVDSPGARPIKVLVLVPSLDVGGAEMDLIRNLPRIDRTRFNITVCTFLARGTMAPLMAQAGIEVIGPLSYPPRKWSVRLRSSLRWARRRLRRVLKRLTSSGQRSFVSRLLSRTRLVFAPLGPLRALAVFASSHFRLATQVAHYIRRADVDVVHTILPNSYLVGALAVRLGRRPGLVMSRLSLNWYQRSSLQYGLVERYLLHGSIDFAIGNCRAILRQLSDEGIDQGKLRLVYNGIDIAEYADSRLDYRDARVRLGLPPNTLVFTSVASLHAYKGHADILRALGLVRDRMPAWILVIAGRDVDGNLAKLTHLAGELGLAQHIRFFGESRDVASILAASDIHISASHTEGFPNNILEAMCAAVPIIATAVGGVPELVVDGRTGLLVPAKDPPGLGCALAELANDSARRHVMRNAGRDHVASHFSIRRSIAALEDIYAASAMRHRRRRVSRIPAQIAKAAAGSDSRSHPPGTARTVETCIESGERRRP